ncbi:NAD(P)H-binding protein [Nocardia sp. NPDC088792]|uniref:NAD(P)H-binding protein n=1 Tax=Nocardia sp. NPDC088792 TaxID=3364332 RepID=UPI003816D127
MTTLITGVRGQVGRTVLDRLHAAGLPVRAASKAPADLTLPAGVEVAELRLDAPETFGPALDGARQVFLYAEPAGIDTFVTAARAAGVDHIVLLSSSAVDSPTAADNPIGARHLAVENALAASGILTTVLRPGGFDSNSLSWARAIAGKQPVELPYPEAALAMIHPGDIADIAVAALTGPELRGRTVSLTGPEAVSFERQIALLGEALGRDIPVVRVSPEQAARQMSVTMPAFIVDTLLTTWATLADTPQPVADTTETLLGVPARSYAQWARENAAAFSA